MVLPTTSTSSLSSRSTVSTLTATSTTSTLTLTPTTSEPDAMFSTASTATASTLYTDNESKSVEDSASNSKYSIINGDSYQLLLAPSINKLSTKVQLENLSLDKPKMTLEKEAIQYIIKIIFDVMNSIIVESYANPRDHRLPENEIDLAMSNMNTSTHKIYLYQLSDLNSIINRIKQVLPRTYAEEVCVKSQVIIEKCQQTFGHSNKMAKLLKSFLSLPIAARAAHRSLKLTQQINNELSQYFTFPIEHFDQILCSVYENKIDLYITLYLISTLEQITKDILYLSTMYVRCLNKETISKRDVHTAIHANHMIIRLVNLNSNFDDYLTEDDVDKDDDDDDDDDDEDNEDGDFGAEFHSDEEANQGCQGTIEFAADNQNDCLSINSLPLIGSSLNRASQNGSSGNEECTSDSSTICAESTSSEQLNLKYQTRVKEFFLEQNQHLTDLNILRRIFMYLFKKFCTLPDVDELIENIFGNINEVYECALKLTDLIDEYLNNGDQQQQQQQHQHQQQQQHQLLLIGEQFWELAEGEEFEVYWRYAKCVTNYNVVIQSLKRLLGDANVGIKLNETKSGLAEISKYLLPRLLLGSVYHFLYVYETVEYLIQMSVDKEDSIFLTDTLDTLKKIRIPLRDPLGFLSSRQRPIETSFRIFQHDQLHMANNSSNNNRQGSNLANLKSLNHSMALRSIASTNSTNSMCREMALAFNICKLTEAKWSEIESNVDSNMPKMVYTTISHCYLFEGEIQLIKSNVPFSPSLSQSSKLKTSKRYVYLFDGLLILLKKQMNGLNTNMSRNLFRYKEMIMLGKCALIDLDDNCKFEIRVYTYTTATADETNRFGRSVEASQNCEYNIFICNSPNEKHKWMYMLCYSLNKLTIDRLLQTMTEEHNRNNPLPIPPPDYPFDQLDSPETIIFEQTGASCQQNKKLTSDSSASSDGFSIKAATLPKLVERLTHHVHLYPKIYNTFLMVFREFCTPEELLTQLSMRYDVPDLDLNKIDRDMYNFNSGGITERELLKRYRREYQVPVRLKLINFIKHWIEGYFNEDFARNEQLLDSLRSLIEKIGATNRCFEQLLNKTLHRKMNQYREQQRLVVTNGRLGTSLVTNELSLAVEPAEDDLSDFKFMFKSSYCSSSSSSSSRSSSVSNSNDVSSEASTPGIVIEDPINDGYPPFETHLEAQYSYDILTVHPLEFARQATLLEEEIFKDIKPNELISTGWMKDKSVRFKLSPNVCKLIKLSNMFTYWYAKCIVETANLDERVAVVNRLLDIAGYFYEMNNFSGLREIYSAFETSGVHRLKLTKERSSLETNRTFAKLKQLFENHDSSYLDRMKKSSPPCLPFIGTFLTHINRTHEYHKVYKKEFKKQLIKEQQSHLINKMDESSSSSSIDSTAAKQRNYSTDLEDQPLQDQLVETCDASRKTNLIVFSKYRKLIELVNDVLQHQNVSYKLRVNNGLRAFVMKDIEKFQESMQTLLNEHRQVEKNNRSNQSSNSCHENEPAASNMRSTSTLDQTIDQWLFETSKKIEPDEKNDPVSTYVTCKQYPRTRQYSLKSPAPSSSTWLMQSHSGHKLAPHKSPFEGVRSQSTNRLDAGKTAIVGKLTGLSTPAGASSSSVNIKSKLNTVLTANSSLNNSVDFAADSKKLHKRSNSSTQQNPLTKAQYQHHAKSSAETNKISISPLSTIKSVNLTTSGGGLCKSNTSDDFLTSTGCSSIGDAVVPLPSLTQSSVGGYLSSSSSPSPTLFVMPAPRNNATFDTITFTSNIFNPDANSNSVVSLQKLSLSSADSCSSQPNSPPPNYEDVFEINTTLPPNQGDNQNLLNTLTSCFDNRPYFQRNQSVLSTGTTSSSTPLTNSSKSASASQPTASNIFSFSERDAQILDALAAPKYKPKAPPTDPPTIFRNRKPTLLQPPPVPPRSTPSQQKNTK